MAIWNRLQTLIFGGAIGAAARTAIEPAIEPARQHAWAQNQVRILDAGVLAQLVAQGAITLAEAEAEASRNGFNPNRVAALVHLAQAGPPVAEALQLWRRGKISEVQIDHALAKAQVEPQFWAPIKELFYGRLDPAVVATAIQRGIMRDPGFLPVGPPTGAGNIAAFPVSPLDPVEEAKASGIDEQRLFVETAIVGLPLALVEAAQGYYRGILTLDDFKRAVAEGNTRNEWGDAALAVSRQILTAGEYAELQLRGYYDRDARLANTGKHGMSTADSDLLYNVLGRSIAVHGVTTGLARGGKYPGSYANVPQPYRAAIQRSNIREEYAELAYANRYSYPSGFQIRSEAQKGDLTAAQTEEILLEVGWSPKWAAFFADKWTAGAAAVADPHVAKAATQLWTTTHSSYKAEEIDAATATQALSAVGVAAGAIPDVLALWDEERSLIRKQLSPAQIRKAVKGQVLNPATGAAWTAQDAISALLARGYSLSDATVFMEEI